MIQHAAAHPHGTASSRAPDGVYCPLARAAPLETRTTTAEWRASGREAEVHHVAVGDDVVFALEPQPSGIARAGLAAERDVIVIADRLGADEAALEVGVDHTRRLRRARAARHRPG